MKTPFQLTVLDAEIDRSTFNCGSEPLDRYLREQVSQDIRRRITVCFVALTGQQRIAGYYTLAAASVLLSDLPPDILKKLPRYPTVPVVRLGRLAVDFSFQKQGLGGALLADALSRSIRSDIAAYAMIVEAKNEIAVTFYRHHGFLPLPETSDTLFLPLASWMGRSKHL